MSYQDFVSAIASKKLSLSALAVLDVICNRYKTDIITNSAVDKKSVEVIGIAPRYAIGNNEYIGGHKIKEKVVFPSFCDPTKGITSLVQSGFIVKGTQKKIDGQPNFWHWADTVSTLSANGKRYIEETPDIFIPLQEALAKEAASQVYVAALYCPRYDNPRYDPNNAFGSTQLFRVLRETPKGFYVEKQEVVSDNGQVLQSFGFGLTTSREGHTMISKENLYKKDDGSFAITPEEFKAIHAVTMDFIDAYTERSKRYEEAKRALKKQFEEEEAQALNAARQSLIDQDLV